MPIASVAPSPVLPGAVADTGASASVPGAGGPGSSPFQALLGPALAGTPSAPAAAPTDALPAALVEPSAVPDAAADSDPPAAEEQAPARSTPAAAGNNLPPPSALGLLLPGLMSVPRSAATSGRGAAAVAAAGVGATNAPAGASADTTPSLAAVLPTPLATDGELGAGNAAANAYLQRFASDPHRLPFAPAADLGAGPLAAAQPSVGKGGSGLHTDMFVLAAPALAAPAHAPATAAPVAAPIDASSPGFRDSPGSAQWQRALDQQLVMMVSKGNQHARIRMHPEELGQLEIRIAVGQDRVDLNFSVQHAAVAAALNQHLPHLAQLFAEQGLAMGQASVSQQQADAGGQTDAGDGRAPRSGANAWAGQSEEIVATAGAWTPLNRGLFDAFA